MLCRQYLGFRFSEAKKTCALSESRKEKNEIKNVASSLLSPEGPSLVYSDKIEQHAISLSTEKSNSPIGVQTTDRATNFEISSESELDSQAESSFILEESTDCSDEDDQLPKRMLWLNLSN